MKRSYLFLLVLVFGIITTAFPQSGDHNYILTKTMLDDTGVASLDKIDYFNGLGRPVQTVLKTASPTRKDIVSLLEYDAIGRESNAWLPVSTGSTGAYVSPTVISSASASFYSDSHAYGKPVYETSPLNRIKEQYGPGSAWYTAGKRIVTDWYTNSSLGELSCALYTIASTTSLRRNGLYPPNELYVTKTTGEDGHVSYTFTDKFGQVVLERIMDGTITNDTYYVYDDFGNRRYVLPPAAADVLTTASTWTDENETLESYAYIYKYDDRNRCIRKKLPGCEPVEMRYDKTNRLIFSQDGNQRSKGEWTFYLYDVFGRPTVTGIWVSSTVPDVTDMVVKTTYDAGGIKLGGYTVTLTLPTTVKLMTVNYYDYYAFTSGVSQLNYVTPPAGYGSQFTSAKGLQTGSRTYRFDDPTKYTISALYYDHRGWVVQTRASNSLGGYDYEYYAYTFTGKVKQRQLIHSAPGKTTQTETYSYDYGTPATNPAERLLSVSYKLNSAATVTQIQYTYDEVGRTLTKKLATETSTYNYNVRSWLTRIQGTKFNQTMTYNATVNGVTPAKALYNGNISAIKWKAGDETTERGYKFSYDNLNRLTAAIYGEGAAITSNLNRFNENVTYNDKMGNIKILQRQGKLDSGYGLMDNLTYTYTGNKLTKVSDAATPSITYPNAFHFVDRANVANEYTYDTNGNLTKDLNKNITSITYNALNLPSVITFSDGNTITYVYDGAGSKLSVAYYNKSDGITTKTEYVGNKVYKNGTLSMIRTEEGYTILSGAIPTYYYYLKDHQGNNRVVINQSGTVQQVNHYYAFGGLFGEGVQISNQLYKYNGKELDRTMGLDMYDFHWRQYMADLGRTTTLDPHAENYHSLSLYSMFANNPVLFIDPDGRDWYRHDEDGSVMWRKGDDAIGGYSNIGTHYTLDLGNGISLTYNQNTPETMVEIVLNEGDWSSQILQPEVGDCFTHSGIMVSASGTESHSTPSQNITDIGEGVTYLDQQIDQGKSARVHVDRIDTKTGEGSGRGRHWVAISSRTTDLQSGQTTSFGFFEPGTGRREAGTSTNNRLNVGQGTLTGPTEYSRTFTYNVTSVRRNK